MPSTWVFDSWALLEFLTGQPAASRVETLLARARGRNSPIWVGNVNLGEVWYAMARKASAEIGDQAVREIHNLGIRLHTADWDMTLAAARFKAGYRISFADGFALALAKHLDASLVTGDPEFKPLEGQVRIHWLER